VAGELLRDAVEGLPNESAKLAPVQLIPGARALLGARGARACAAPMPPDPVGRRDRSRGRPPVTSLRSFTPGLLRSFHVFFVVH
jgi:hypothetical protein